MSKFPVITAGKRITGNLLRQMQTETVWKTGDTDRSSATTGTTFVIDPDLQMSLDAGQWEVEAYVLYGALLAADIKVRWTVPGGSLGYRQLIGPGSTASNSSGDNISGRFGIHGFTTSIVYSGVRDSNSNQVGFYERIQLWNNTPGTLGIEWAQDTANATATRVGLGSLLKVRQLAP